MSKKFLPLGDSRPVIYLNPALRIVLRIVLRICFLIDTVGFRGTAVYQLGNTSSRMITEVKQRRARLVLGWATVPSVA